MVQESRSPPCHSAPLSIPQHQTTRVTLLDNEQKRRYMNAGAIHLLLSIPTAAELQKSRLFASFFSVTGLLLPYIHLLICLPVASPSFGATLRGSRVCDSCLAILMATMQLHFHSPSLALIYQGINDMALSSSSSIILLPFPAENEENSFPAQFGLLTSTTLRNYDFIPPIASSTASPPPLPAGLVTSNQPARFFFPCTVHSPNQPTTMSKPETNDCH